MEIYRSFRIDVNNNVICISDPTTNRAVMIKYISGIEDPKVYGRSMVDQYISDCVGAQYRYESWVRHNLTGKQYHDWLHSKRA